MPRAIDGRRSTLLIAIALSCQSSCSVVSVQGPPAQHARLPYFDCTSSRLAPNLDLIVGILVGAAGAGAVADARNSDDRQAGAVSLTIGAALLASAVHGWNTTAACRDAKVDLQARLQMQARYPRQTNGAADPWHGDNEDVLPAVVSPAVVSPSPTNPSGETGAAAPGKAAPAYPERPPTEPKP